MTISDLPAVNASLNTTCAVLLSAGFWFIRRKQVNAHRACMVAACAVSTIFLACYLYYHYHHGRTTFTHQGWIRPVYFTILLTHTILAIVMVPMILVTLWRAFSGQFEKHKRLARWTWPIWLYVSVTGVVVYLILYQFYPAGQ